MMKKVFFMISTLNVGGAETLVKDYALLMDKERFEIKIISLDKSYHSANDMFLQKAGIPVIYLSELRYSAEKKLNFFQKVIRSIARYIDLKNIIKNEKPDILHVHLYIGNYLRWIPLKKWGIKVFYTVHNKTDHYYDRSGRDRKKYLAYKEIKRLLKKENLTLIALHDELKRELCELFHTKQVITVNNGINLDRFHKELYNRLEMRTNLGLSEKTILIGHIGRFHEQKNHKFLIEVFQRLCLSHGDVHLLLVGTGILREEVENQIKIMGLQNRVTIFQNRSDIPELMSAMDVFLFPSKWEGAPIVLIEAQSMGLPCVVSDQISADVIVNTNVSVLSLNDSPDKWADAVLQSKEGVVSDKIQKYDIRSSVKKLEKIYLDN